MIGFIIGLIVGEISAFLVFAFGNANKEPQLPGKKLVYISSPYRDRKRNLWKAEKYTRATLDAGAAPITPHLFYSSVLDDANAQQREMGMAAGTSILLRCDEVWAFGEPSEGMKFEIAAAKQANIPVIYHSEAGGRKEQANE